MIGQSNENVERLIAHPDSLTSNIPSIICSVFQNLRIITMTRIGIERVDENSFKSCRNLQALTLSNNQISKVDENVFAESQNLRFLSLSSNPLILPAKVFHPLVNLLELYLERCQLPSLDQNLFSTLTQLTYLALNFNNISELPVGVFSSLVSLEFFYMQNNNLTVFSSNAFGNHPRLDYVFLSYNEINAFDEKFIDNTRVSALNIYYNVCAHGGTWDLTAQRISIRRLLAVCIDNYNRDFPAAKIGENYRISARK